MIADRSYSLGLSADQRASLFYFAAAVPTVGFVHGAAHLDAVDAAALESYGAGVRVGPSIGAMACRKGSSRQAPSTKPWALPLGWLA
jgi:hypothetical protein